MAEKYQTYAQKSTKKFEVLGRKTLAVNVPLPLVEVWEQLQPEVEQLTERAGLQIIRAVIEDEVTRRVGPQYQPAGEGGCLRWGHERFRDLPGNGILQKEGPAGSLPTKRGLST